MTVSELRVGRKALARVHAGHLWIYANEIEGNLKTCEPGSIVDALDPKGDLLGRGFVNPQSLIAVRLLARERREIDRGFFIEAIGAAIALRRSVYGEREAVRLVFGESDWLPGLIVDRYGDVLVVQSHALGIDRLMEPILDALEELLHPRAIVLRNDLPVRALEGAEQEKRVARGTLPEVVEVEVDGVRLEVDVLRGQKTGLFLDQADNRARLAPYVRDGRVFDAFCYAGQWGLAAAAQGAREVVFADTSEWALEAAERHVKANFPDLIARFHAVDMTSGFRKIIGQETFDAVIVDPPAFARRKRDVPDAVRAYRTLNSRAIGLVRPGGVLVTSSCSFHIYRETFEDLLRKAGRDSGRRLRILERGGPGRDHPILLGHPETEYLKCLFLRVD